MRIAIGDRGSQFAGHMGLKKELKLDLNFGYPYCSWQRGSNENGLLWEFFSKKTDLGLVTEKELQQPLFLINSRPRKWVGWKPL